MPSACVTVIVVTQEVLADVDEGLFAAAPECVTDPTYLAAPLTRAIPVLFIDLTGFTGPTRGAPARSAPAPASKHSTIPWVRPPRRQRRSPDGCRYR
jgi:hypothetical protein